MKNLMMTAALLIGLAGTGYAQDRPQGGRPGPGRPGAGMMRNQEIKSPEERAKMMTEAMEKRLNLTADQKENVYALNLDRATKMDKMRQSQEKIRKEQMEKGREIMEEHDKKLNKILNEEQQKVLSEAKEKQKQRMQEHRQHMMQRRKN